MDKKSHFIEWIFSWTFWAQSLDIYDPWPGQLSVHLIDIFHFRGYPVEGINPDFESANSCAMRVAEKILS